MGDAELEEMYQYHDDDLAKYQGRLQEHKLALANQRDAPNFQMAGSGPEYPLYGGEEDYLYDGQDVDPQNGGGHSDVHERLIEKGKQYKEKQEEKRQQALEREAFTNRPLKDRRPQLATDGKAPRYKRDAHAVEKMWEALREFLNKTREYVNKNQGDDTTFCASLKAEYDRLPDFGADSSDPSGGSGGALVQRLIDEVWQPFGWTNYDFDAVAKEQLARKQDHRLALWKALESAKHTRGHLLSSKGLAIRKVEQKNQMDDDHEVSKRKEEAANFNPRISQMGKLSTGRLRQDKLRETIDSWTQKKEKAMEELRTERIIEEMAQ
eukprot:gene19732-995_t